MSVERLEAAIATLSERGWFAQRAPAARALLAGVARLRDYRVGQFVFRYGDPPDGVYGLVAGTVEITIPRVDGLELTVHRAECGFWVGDLALLAHETRLVSVRAATNSYLLHLPQDALSHLTDKHPTLYRDFYALSHENMSRALDIVGNLATSSSEARVALRLLQQQQWQPERSAVRLSRVELAELVALSLPTLQRVLRRFADAGLIELGYGVIRIMDREGLCRVCGQEDGG